MRGDAALPLFTLGTAASPPWYNPYLCGPGAIEWGECPIHMIPSGGGTHAFNCRSRPRSKASTTGASPSAPKALPATGDLFGWGLWSWSPDGRKLAGTKLRGGSPGGILVYSLESQRYERLTDFGGNPVWLSDSRRLVFQHQGKLSLIDSRSKRVRELLSVGPNVFGNGFTISRDDRQIYFSLVTTEADIWLMTLE